MFKKILVLVLVVAMLFCVSACGNYAGDEKQKDSPLNTNSENSSNDVNSTGTNSNTATQSNITPLLYKATDSKGNEVYLFGSIHIGYEEMYPLPQYVLDAYNKSDVLAVEFDIVAFEEDTFDAQSLFAYFVYSDGTTIKDHINSTIYKQAVEILKDNNYYGIAMDYYNAYLWSDIINSFLQEKSRYDIDYGIDRYFINNAHKTNKPIDEVESAEFQYKMSAGFSDGLQELLLQSAIESYMIDNYDEQVKELIDAWCKGNHDEIVSLARTDASDPLLTAEQKRLIKEYDDELIVKRNITMTDYAEDALSSGDKVFICVGAAHVVGDDGMVELLKQRGYTVEQVK